MTKYQYTCDFQTIKFTFLLNEEYILTTDDIVTYMWCFLPTLLIAKWEIVDLINLEVQIINWFRE